MKDAHRIAALRQLCCLGVGGQASMPTLLKAVRELVPSDSAGFFWVSAAGDMTNLYAERVLPESAAEMFFERYHDGPEHSFKRDFLLRAAAGSPVSTAEPTPAFVKGDYYNSIMRALDAHYVMHGIVREHSAALGQVSLYRNKSGKAFSTGERQRLADIARYLGHALAKPTELKGEFVDTDDEGVVIISGDGVVQHAAGHSRRLLLMATHPQHGASNRASLKSEVVETVLKDLVARLKQTLAIDAHAPPPKLVVANAWGRFALRAYYLSEADAADSPAQIAVQIRRQEPLLIKLAEGLRKIDLAPQLQQVALRLAQGESNGEIASALNVTENTVRWHIKQLFAKLGTHDRSEAIAQLRAG